MVMNDRNDASGREEPAPEERIFDAEFLAPVIRDGYLRVRIAGILCQLVPEDPGFEGWAILSPVSFSTARIVGYPDRALVQSYLGLFPAVDLVLTHIRDGRWHGVSAPSARKAPLRIEGAVPVLLSRGAARNDRIRARFDGKQFWFDRVLSRSPRTEPHPGVGPDDGAVPSGVVRFRALDREYRVIVNPGLAPPMVSGVALDPARRCLDRGTLAGIVHRGGARNGLTPTEEYAGAWT